MKLNLAHSEFPEQQGGLMICGYEWGGGGNDDDDGGERHSIDWQVECTFANKQLRYGPNNLKEPYSNRIKKWLALWGHPLNYDNPGEFEKSIIQTNWCDTQNPNMDNDYTALWKPDQVQNFLGHVKYFSPNLIIFMGSKLIDALQYPTTLAQFEYLVGECKKPLKILQKPFEGRRFKVSFQTFEKCDVACFPHPSASMGLSDEYISLFNDEMRERLADYGLARMYSRSFPGCKPANRR